MPLYGLTVDYYGEAGLVCVSEDCDKLKARAAHLQHPKSERLRANMTAQWERQKNGSETYYARDTSWEIAEVEVI